MIRTLLASSAALTFVGCLAPPPPISVETPYGDVRAATPERAEEIAELLRELSPKVQEMLPGSLSRPIDVWVQQRLQVYRFTERPESVRGFTLLSDDFHARRIHLQEGGQSPWYLAHELVHALIGPSWKPLPGILEEGIGDVLAEHLNPYYASHIRAHRLLNASAATEGFLIRIAYSRPDLMRRSSEWQRIESTTRVQTSAAISPELARDLLSTSRTELHRRWPEIPETFYGFAWLVVDRIDERHGLAGLHALCERATAEGLDIVPAEWLLAAAELDPERLGPEFLTACFGRGEMLAAVSMQPELFCDLAAEILRPFEASFDAPDLLRYVNPAIRLSDGSELPYRFVSTLRHGLTEQWGRPASRVEVATREAGRMAGPGARGAP